MGSFMLEEREEGSVENYLDEFDDLCVAGKKKNEDRMVS